MSYDPDLKQIVVQGGRSDANGGAWGDTWVWDGARGAWTEQTPSDGNNFERVGQAMVYDPVRKKTFLFGGWQPASGLYLGDMWEWDGSTQTWTPRTSANAPSARYGHAMIWDPERQRVVLFGGKDETGQLKNDLWEWDGTSSTWTPRPQTGTIPTPRHGAKMAYDLARKTALLRSGNTVATDPGTWTNDTYEWDEATSTWTKPTPTANPVYFSYGYDQLAYDAVRSKIVLYSAYTFNMYEWSPPAGTTAPTWAVVTSTKVDPATPANGAALAFDSSQGAMGQVVIFGGLNTRTLWQWNAADASWINRSTPFVGPLQRNSPALAFDTMRDKLMLFGGLSASTYYQDIQEWSHVDATFLNRSPPGTKPDGRYQSAMAYDSKRDQMLLYGGIGTTSFSDLWSWAPSTRAWTLVPITTTPRPPVLTNHSMFYDVASDKLLMVGTSGAIPIWQLDLATGLWTDRTVASTTALGELYGHVYYSLAFDSDRRKVVAFGGYYQSKDTADIFEWDLGSGMWTKRDAPAGAVPGGRKLAGFSYDSARRVMVLVGGQGGVTGVYGSNPVDDSWEWDGTTNTWSETTPDPVRPLPRYQHDLLFDPGRATTILSGGTVPADTIYGLSEIWEYSADSTPRANGAACSAATAANCASHNCVDGVCCAAAACPGTCQACNVPGPNLGACSAVLAGTSDDSCASDQACDANHQCKSRPGQACGHFTDCASGHCADGVCCDSDCTDTCKACNLSRKGGVCTNIPSGNEDPIGAPVCVSDAAQGRFCDGNGVCTNAPKPIGSSCTASGQCAKPSGGSTSFCIDGVCCNSACVQTCYACNNPTSLGTCSALAAGLPDHSATIPCDGAMQYCGGSVCQTNKKPTGAMGCATGTDCGSGFCVDNYCCNSACLGTCQGCNVPGKGGSCVNLPVGQADNLATVTCPLPQYCDAGGTCQSGLKANGVPCGTAVQCATGFCVDGVCCENACGKTCMACNVPNAEGSCIQIPAGGTDSTVVAPAATCGAPNYCAGGSCTQGKKPNGATCTLGNECGSNYCIDGTCCENACIGNCLTCKNATGSCGLTPSGQDPRKDCGSGDCAGSCDGQGACIYPASGKTCGKAGCASDGVIRQPGTCDGSGSCTGDVLNPCNGFRCYHDAMDNMDKCATSCATDPNCQNAFYCDDTAHCPADFPNGHSCTRDQQCVYNHCAIVPGDTTGVCCDRDCRACGTCNKLGEVGTCVPTSAGTDPSHDCIDSASDPSGKCGGTCNGQWACEFPPSGTACGTCKVCDGASKCNVMPEDDAMCGVIDCDGLDTDCRDFHDIQVRRCASVGACKAPNNVVSCTDVTVICQPDAGGDSGGDSGGTGATDGAIADTGAGTDTGSDAPAPPKSGGGGCGCDLGAGSRGGGSAGLLSALLIAGFFVAGRRRGRRR